VFEPSASTDWSMLAMGRVRSDEAESWGLGMRWPRPSGWPAGRV